MPIVAPTAGSYPTIEDVFNSVRVHVNDTFAGATATLGEGRIFTDSWTPNITILNLALQHLQRDLENYGFPTTREVTFIINGLTPINGPLGLGVPDPSVQVYLSFNGYWDGSVLHGSPTLPLDLLTPLKISQRQTGSGNPFAPVLPAPDGLPSINQAFSLGWWNWITDKIFFNGSQNTIDIQLTYTGGVPKYPLSINPNTFPTTLIPFLDSQEALSYWAAYIFCAPRLPKGGAEELAAGYRAAMIEMANRWIRMTQRTPVVRQAFGGWGGEAYPEGEGGC